MKSHPAVFCSNLINRYGMVMPTSVLHSALNQTWNRPLPSSIGHDRHRLIGFNLPKAVQLEPGLARLFGNIFRVETDEDFEQAKQVLYASLQQHENALDSEKVADLRNRLTGVISQHAELNAQACAAFVDPGIVRRKFPTLFNAADKHGLIPFAMLNPVAPGVFEKDGLLLFAHRYFRRSLSRLNTLNDPFLSRLAEVSKNPELDVRIALDEDLIGHPDTLQREFELEYWWGPKFSDQLADIPHGVTRHRNSEADLLFQCIQSTEFWWYGQGGNKTFECEELRDLDSPSLGVSETNFGCRFVHSFLSNETGLPVHLDGAIRLYNVDLYLERFDLDLHEFGRKADYNKIWRIDGPLTLASWKELICHYYRDNHLIGEYFGGEEVDEQSAGPIAVKQQNLPDLSYFIPYRLKKGDGIRISLSYVLQNETTAVRSLTPTETYGTSTDRRDFIECCTIDLIKLIRREIGEIVVPDNLLIMGNQDVIRNFPLIEHCAPTSCEDANATLSMIRRYCEAHSCDGDDRLISFHIGVRYPDRDAQFSFAGSIDDMCQWLAADCAHFPSALDEMAEWLESAGKWLTEKFGEEILPHQIGNLLKTSGLLTLERKFLNPEDFEFVEPVGHPPKIKLLETTETIKALPLIGSGNLITSYAHFVHEYRCNGCGDSYFDCGCIKKIDSGVCCTLLKGEICGVFWTDRPSWKVLRSS